MKSIHVHIARHYWRNGEFAVWQATDNFPTSLLTWLKATYSELVAGSRPLWIDRPEGRVFLFFLDEHEVHGRMATKLTACWLDCLVTDPKKTSEQLGQVVQSAHDDQLSGISVKTMIVQREKPNLARFIFLGVCILIIIGLGYWFFASKSNTPNPSVELPVMTHQEKKQEVTKSVTQIKNPRLEVKKPQSSKFTLCGNLQQKIQWCYQQFISDKCSGKTKENYDSWLRHLKKNNHSLFKRNACPENLKHDRDLNGIRDSKNKKILRDFLKQEGKQK